MGYPFHRTGPVAPISGQGFIYPLYQAIGRDGVLFTPDIGVGGKGLYLFDVLLVSKYQNFSGAGSESTLPLYSVLLRFDYRRGVPLR